MCTVIERSIQGNPNINQSPMSDECASAIVGFDKLILKSK
jgi:hypothetical protein